MKKRNQAEKETGLEKILAGFNNTRAEYPRDKTIHELFEQQVEKNPAEPAAIFNGRSITYRQLNRKANRLARRLRSRGIGPGCIVAIMVERSFEMIAGLFGILKAGGAYLPISPGTPGTRILHMIRDARVSILLCSGKAAAEIETGESIADAKVINLEDPRYDTGPDSNLPHITGPRDPVYVIYTSGSTGKPKGVIIEHRSLVNRLNWMQKKYPLDRDDVILQKTPFVFDVSLWELFWWSMVGTKVCFMLPRLERFPQAIVDTVEKNKVTVMHFVPSMLNAFLQYIAGSGDVKRISCLRKIFASGEALSTAHVRKFNEILHQTNGTKLINLYGPTEATVDVSYFDCPTDVTVADKIPIGKPIDNTGFLVMKENRILPPGEEGELCIYGDCLSRGYLNRVELTAEKFPAASNFQLSNFQLIYKTGDLARWRKDGNVEFLGRIDFQVKIRGLRIELGEIEACLLKHEAVENCVVTVKKHSESMVVLIAYIVAPEDCPLKELTGYLKKYLPEYMIPNRFVIMKSLPVTPTGKIDRKALPEH